jgi:hypothetical protein
MTNYIKTFFIKHNVSVNKKSIGLKHYPITVSSVGFFCLNSNFPEVNFIKKLKNTFGEQTQFTIFSLGNKIEIDNGYALNNKIFDLFGKIKNPALHKDLCDLDILIDTTIYNLSINLKSLDYNLFADEIIKYHKILVNGNQ